jgi:hypothetical protein
VSRDKAKRVEPVPSSKGKESPGFFSPGLQLDCSNCSDVIPKHRSHKSDQAIVQKMQVIVQKNASQAHTAVADAATSIGLLYVATVLAQRIDNANQTLSS